MDGAGNLFIADTFNHRIRRVEAATGTITTVVGNGELGFIGDELGDLVLEIAGVAAATDAEENAVARLAVADLLWQDGMLPSSAWTTWKDLPDRLANYFQEWPEDEEWPEP